MIYAENVASHRKEIRINRFLNRYGDVLRISGGDKASYKEISELKKEAVKHLTEETTHF